MGAGASEVWSNPGKINLVFNQKFEFLYVICLLLFRGKHAQRPNKDEVYDEDDPEAYTDMPVPDKVRHAVFYTAVVRSLHGCGGFNDFFGV